MRDIARNFQAMPLVAWMVWIAIATIAAPVMALPTEAQSAGSEDITPEDITLSALLAGLASAQATEVPDSDAAESEDPGSDTSELDAEITPEAVSVAGVADSQSVESPASILLVQANSSDLAEPSDPFFFDENSVEPSDDGVLAPLSRTETLPDGTSGEVAELEDGPLTPPSLKLQTAAIQEGNDFSARARVYGHYFLESNVAVVGAVDLSTGDAFSDTDSTGFNISELYVVASPSDLPSLRGAVGLIELSSFFDRNSFAKIGRASCRERV